MLQYLIVLLDDTSVSFCQYQTDKKKRNLISLDKLKRAIQFGMMENLNIQFIYPPTSLPKEYIEVIETIDHCKVKPFGVAHDNRDIVVISSWNDIHKIELGKSFVFRTTKDALFARYEELLDVAKKGNTISLVILDVETFSEEDFVIYKEILSKMATEFATMIENNITPQLNILTDRLILKQMNNCDAGDKSVTLAPNGKFYICPAFYYENSEEYVGDLSYGLDIKNQRLYKLQFAPICSHCDAFQCKRCVWLNRKQTLEVNTPSHEQCVVAHLERNASRALLNRIKDLGKKTNRMAEIDEIDYLDPITKHKEWQ